jgi:D-alanyl-lipoteichoic acid acyltransferase DltB (MBOAT superfamily)
MILILEGLFRKLVIADNCALIANSAFNGHLGAPDVAITLLGTYAFAWQIYGDFSGYSSIARGSAQLLGFHFMVNFRQPYLATSLQDFWRRWHISLSTFLRDYLYIRLGGNRLGPRRTYGNLLATMLLGGLWHGANWTFVIWGGIHGAALAVERKLFGADGDGQALPFARRWIRRITLFHVVCLAWVFFRASSLAEASNFLAGILHPHWEPIYATAAAYLALSAAGLFVLDLELERSKSEYLLEGRGYTTRVVVGVLLVIAISLLTAGSQSAFIYFQF